jgi:hypothetical protein
MECINHEKTAKCICINCGKALCDECKILTPSGKVSCSDDCTNEITTREAIIQQTLSKTTSSAMSSAYGAYLLGAIFIWFGIYTNIKELNLFLTIAGAGMLIMGAFFHYAANSRNRKK